MLCILREVPRRSETQPFQLVSLGPPLFEGDAITASDFLLAFEARLTCARRRAMPTPPQKNHLLTTTMTASPSFSSHSVRMTSSTELVCSLLYVSVFGCINESDDG